MNFLIEAVIDWFWVGLMDKLYRKSRLAFYAVLTIGFLLLACLMYIVIF